MVINKVILAYMPGIFGKQWHRVHFYDIDVMAGVQGIYFCQIEIISGLTDKGQFQYLTGLKGPKEGIYLYKAKFLSLR